MDSRWVSQCLGTNFLQEEVSNKETSLFYSQWYDIVYFGHKPSWLCFWFHLKWLILIEMLSLIYISTIFSLSSQYKTLIAFPTIIIKASSWSSKSTLFCNYDISSITLNWSAFMQPHFVGMFLTYASINEVIFYLEKKIKIERLNRHNHQTLRTKFVVYLIIN